MEGDGTNPVGNTAWSFINYEDNSWTASSAGDNTEMTTWIQIRFSDISEFKYRHPSEMSCTDGFAAGNWVRPFGDVHVPNSEAGFEQCARQCRAANYTYFGLECPGTTAHCQCTSSLAESASLQETSCSSEGHGGAGGYGGYEGYGENATTYCPGPFVRGHYLMGGYKTASVYRTKELKPTQMGPLLVDGVMLQGAFR